MKEWRKLLEEGEWPSTDIKMVYLNEEERIFILKMLFNVPIHQGIKMKCDMLIGLADRLGADEILGKIETIIKGGNSGEQTRKNKKKTE